mgnify:CR=1 FL=1
MSKTIKLILNPLKFVNRHSGGMHLSTEPVPNPTLSLYRYKPLSALETVIRNQRLVLLGAPGSGKSTFLQCLAFSLAQPQLDPLEADDYLLDWPEDEGDLLPIVFTLRDFVRWAKTHGQ